MIKRLSYLLCLLLLFFLTFDFLVFQLQRYQIRCQFLERAEKEFPDELLVTFKYPCSNPGAFESDEFSFQNSMYDVVSRESRGDSVIVHCVNDSREEALMDSFFRQLSNSNNKSYPVNNASKNWLLNKIFFDPPGKIHFNVFSDRIDQNDKEKFKLLTSFINIQDPPPEAELCDAQFYNCSFLL
jgi:hypothetical protein